MLVTILILSLHFVVVILIIANKRISMQCRNHYIYKISILAGGQEGERVFDLELSSVGFLFYYTLTDVFCE